MKAGILHDYATGIAVVDRAEGESTLKIKLLDPLPNMSGEVDDSFDEVECEVVILDSKVARKIKLGDWITANWFNTDANRQTPPDIMKGERVRVLKVGDKEEYYWEALSVDNHLRTTERIIFYISNTNRDDRTDKVLSPDNCYFIEFNTIDKQLRIQTNKNDGEPFAHEFILQTLEGYFKYSDDVGNHALVDSKNTVIEFINKDKTQYRMDKKDIIEKCEGNYTREIGGNLIEKVGGTRTINTTGASTYTYGGDVTVDAPNYTVTTTFTINGESTLNGAVSMTSGMSLSGDMTMAGGSMSGSDSIDTKDLSSKSFNYP